MAARTQDQGLRAFSRIRDGVCAVDASQRIICWNKGAERILGYRRSEALGRPCYEIIPGQRCGKRFCRANCRLLGRVFDGLLPGNFNLLTRTKKGKSIWVNVTIIAWPMEGEPLTVHVMRNATRRERAEAVAKHILGAVRARRAPRKRRAGKTSARRSSRSATSRARFPG